MPRNLILCLDGTSNGPETGATNVSRMYDIARKCDEQLCYYDAGVGTIGARSATTVLGQALTKAAGLIAGFGLAENIQEAYAWLSQRYGPGDSIYVFGFSRGAYTARALTGMLPEDRIGATRPGQPRSVRVQAVREKPQQDGGIRPHLLKEDEEGGAILDASRSVPTPVRQSGFSPSLWSAKARAVLGVWDTVHAMGWLNVLWGVNPRLLPFTRHIDNVETARHALAIDEHRRPYRPSRFWHSHLGASNIDHREMWFAAHTATSVDVPSPTTGCPTLRCRGWSRRLIPPAS